VELDEPNRWRPHRHPAPAPGIVIDTLVWCCAMVGLLCLFGALYTTPPLAPLQETTWFRAVLMLMAIAFFLRAGLGALVVWRPALLSEEQRRQWVQGVRRPRLRGSGLLWAGVTGGMASFIAAVYPRPLDTIVVSDFVLLAVIAIILVPVWATHVLSR
jgi:hypothetical protein